MNFFFDNCTSPVLAETVGGFVRHLEQTACHIRDGGTAGLPVSRNATDAEWIAALGADPREWIVVTSDRRIGRVRAEREAFRRARLKGFLLDPAYQKMAVNEQASALLWRWPELVKVIESFRAPTLIGVPQSKRGKLKPPSVVAVAPLQMTETFMARAPRAADGRQAPR